jgi:hypothetical protein
MVIFVETLIWNMFKYYFHSQVSGKKNCRSGSWISSDDVPISTMDYSISKKLTYTFFG